MDWTKLGKMTANCLESEIFRDSKLDWSNWLYFSFFSVCSFFRLLVTVRYCITVAFVYSRLTY